MLNLLPGQGLGFSGSQLLGFGLGAVTDEEIIIPQPPVTVIPGGGGGTLFWSPSIKISDNAYSRRKDDSEIIDFLTILFQVIE